MYHSSIIITTLDGEITNLKEQNERSNASNVNFCLLNISKELSKISIQDQKILEMATELINEISTIIKVHFGNKKSSNSIEFNIDALNEVEKEIIKCLANQKNTIITSSHLSTIVKGADVTQALQSLIEKGYIKKENNLIWKLTPEYVDYLSKEKLFSTMVNPAMVNSTHFKRKIETAIRSMPSYNLSSLEEKILKLINEKNMSSQKITKTDIWTYFREFTRATVMPAISKLKENNYIEDDKNPKPGLILTKKYKDFLEQSNNHEITKVAKNDANTSSKNTM